MNSYDKFKPPVSPVIQRSPQDDEGSLVHREISHFVRSDGSGRVDNICSRSLICKIGSPFVDSLSPLIRNSP